MVVVQAGNAPLRARAQMKKMIVLVGFVSMCMLVVSNYGACLKVQVNVVLLEVVVDVVVIVGVEV